MITLLLNTHNNCPTQSHYCCQIMNKCTYNSFIWDKYNFYFWYVLAMLQPLYANFLPLSILKLLEECVMLLLCMAVLGVHLKGCPGARCHKYEYIGALQYTTLIFGFSFLQVLARIKEDTM